MPAERRNAGYQTFHSYDNLEGIGVHFHDLDYVVYFSSNVEHYIQDILLNDIAYPLKSELSQ